jgi:hypothetical protein
MDRSVYDQGHIPPTDMGWKGEHGKSSQMSEHTTANADCRDGPPRSTTDDDYYDKRPKQGYIDSHRN